VAAGWEIGVGDEFQVKGESPAAPFDLTLHRGDGMTISTAARAAGGNE
jgi:hypothetical protein